MIKAEWLKEGGDEQTTGAFFVLGSVVESWRDWSNPSQVKGLETMGSGAWQMDLGSLSCRRFGRGKERGLQIWAVV